MPAEHRPLPDAAERIALLNQALEALDAVLATRPDLQLHRMAAFYWNLHLGIEEQAMETVREAREEEEATDWTLREEYEANLDALGDDPSFHETDAFSLAIELLGDEALDRPLAEE